MIGSFWNDPAIVLFILIGILIADNIWALYLLLREILLTSGIEAVPDILRPYLSEDTFQAMRTYKLHKSWLYIVNTLLTVVICGCLELYFGFYAFVWQLATTVSFAKWMKHEAFVSIIFVAMVNITLAIKSLPARIYEKRCITSLIVHHQAKWYIRVIMFVVDTLLSLFIMAVVVVLVVLLVDYLDEYSFLGLYVLSVLFTILLIMLVPYVIDPFLGKRVPLENTALRTELERLTAKVGFPMRQVHIIRVRDPSVGSNAFFYGSCCFKRIVIFNTLLLNQGLSDTSKLPPEDWGKGLRDEQVVAVVAHELGHWKCGHFYKSLLGFKIHLFLTLLLFAFFFPHGPIYQAVGFEPGLQPIIAGFLIIFGYVLTPYFTLSNVLMLTMTRHFEYQADRFAYELGYAANLKKALLKLYADNLSFPISDECYSIWNHTHPTVLHRLSQLDQLEA